jgi:hypothetical protein
MSDTDRIFSLLRPTQELRTYTSEVQRRLKVLATKPLAQYDKGLLTFEELVSALTEIDDAKVYEEVAADPRF